MGNERRFSRLEVNALTFHRSKGLEADYTILLDVSEGEYGVPSQIEEDELLSLVVPESESYPYAEERRLFYVAPSRASRGIYILADEKKPSRYIAELKQQLGDDMPFELVDGYRPFNFYLCISPTLIIAILMIK